MLPRVIWNEASKLVKEDPPIIDQGYDIQTLDFVLFHCLRPPPKYPQSVSTCMYVPLDTYFPEVLVCLTKFFLESINAPDDTSVKGAIGLESFNQKRHDNRQKPTVFITRMMFFKRPNR